jgi:hypothetical protein
MHHKTYERLITDLYAAMEAHERVFISRVSLAAGQRGQGDACRSSGRLEAFEFRVFSVAETNSRLAWVTPGSVSGGTRKPRRFAKSPGCASSRADRKMLSRMRANVIAAILN